MNYLTEEQQYNVPDGSKVLALYIGAVQFEGIVAGSRAGYGKRKLYDVTLLQDMYLPWCGDGKSARYKAGELLEIEHKNIVAYL